MSGPFHDPATRARFCEAYFAGQTVPILAHMFGTDAATVIRGLTRFGLTGRRGPIVRAVMDGCRASHRMPMTWDDVARDAGLPSGGAAYAMARWRGFRKRSIRGERPPVHELTPGQRDFYRLVRGKKFSAAEAFALAKGA